MIRSKTYRGLLSLGGGTLFGLAAGATDVVILLSLHESFHITNVVVSNVLTGVVASALWWVLLTWEARKLQIRQALNDRVRNALQPILYSTVWVEDKHYREVVVGGCYHILQILNEELELDVTTFPNHVRGKAAVQVPEPQ